MDSIEKEKRETDYLIDKALTDSFKSTESPVNQSNFAIKSVRRSVHVD